MDNQISNRKYRVILATAIPELNKELMLKKDLYAGNEIEYMKICNYVQEVTQALEEVENAIAIESQNNHAYNYIPVLVMSLQLGGLSPMFDDTTEKILEWKNTYPHLKVILILGQIKMNSHVSILLTSLAKHQVLLFAKETIDYTSIVNEILNDKSYLEVLKDVGVKESATKVVSSIKYAAEDKSINVSSILSKNNISVVSSMKPGTGKSFASTNIAVGLAAFGSNPENGKPLNVCLLEGDLQTLSVGTLLVIENSDKNLLKCILKINDFLQGEKTNYEEALLRDFIMKCLIKYKGASNLSVLCGSKLDLGEVEMVTAQAFEYLLNFLSEQFDLVVIDMNSSFHHTTTQPALQHAGKIFYVVNLDFNNIFNNTRYLKELKDFGLDDKVKYILNQDTSDFYVGPAPKCTADFLDKEIRISYRIQDLTSTIFNNLCFEGEPVILTEYPYTLQQRVEILKIVEDICGSVPKLAQLKADYAMNLNQHRKKGGQVQINVYQGESKDDGDTNPGLLPTKNKKKFFGLRS